MSRFFHSNLEYAERSLRAVVQSDDSPNTMHDRRWPKNVQVQSPCCVADRPVTTIRDDDVRAQRGLVLSVPMIAFDGYGLSL